MTVWDRIKCRLSQVVRIRMRGCEVPSLEDAIALTDRFLKNDPTDPLEWDDFVSYAHPNARIERMRDQLADTEAGWFGSEPNARKMSLMQIISIRDSFAKEVGVPPLNDEQVARIIGIWT